MSRHFTCAMCKEVFKSETSPEEAMAEFAQNFPGAEPDPTARVCDDCYEIILEHQRGLPQ